MTAQATRAVRDAATTATTGRRPIGVGSHKPREHPNEYAHDAKNQQHEGIPSHRERREVCVANGGRADRAHHSADPTRSADEAVEAATAVLARHVGDHRLHRRDERRQRGAGEATQHDELPELRQACAHGSEQAPCDSCDGEQPVPRKAACIGKRTPHWTEGGERKILHKK